MRARCDLRHDAAERRVLLDLAQHDVGKDFPSPSASRRTTAAAVSSQLVSMPSSVKARAGGGVIEVRRARG